MYLWLLIIGVFIPQEFISAGAVLLIARSDSFPFWLVHLIWFGTTFFDMYVGYVVGKYLQRRFHGTKFIERTDRWAGKIKEALGKHGEQLSLVFLGLLSFPYINTFFAAWLKLRMRTAFLYTFLGNLVWYLLLLTTIFGTAVLIPDPATAVFSIIIVGVASNLLLRFYGKHKRRGI